MPTRRPSSGHTMALEQAVPQCHGEIFAKTVVKVGDCFRKPKRPGVHRLMRSERCSLETSSFFREGGFRIFYINIKSKERYPLAPLDAGQRIVCNQTFNDPVLINSGRPRRLIEPNCLSHRYSMVVANEGPKSNFSVLKLKRRRMTLRLALKLPAKTLNDQASCQSFVFKRLLG